VFGVEHAPFLIRLSQKLPHNPSERLAGRSFDDLYKVHELPKKAGGKRLITAPCEPLKRLQRAILDRGLNPLPVHEAAAGFRRGSSIRENAARHVGQRVVVNADIHNCFPSTGHPRILQACQGIVGGRLSPLARAFAAEICSYGGALPTGAPTSPALLNLVLRGPDRAIATVASRKGVAYSRYADDLTLSGGNEAVAILPFVKDILGTLGYELEAKKTNIFRRGRRQIVTGLVVNVKPNWPKALRRRLRAAVHRRTRGEQPTWHERPISDAELKGYLAFLNQTQPTEASRLLAQLQEMRP
jgi:RNA-directed DNA polymerase